MHVYFYIYVFFEVTNVQNSVITMIEFRQLRYVKLERQHTFYSYHAHKSSSSFIGVVYGLFFTPCSCKNGHSSGKFGTVRKQVTEVAQFFRCIHKLRKGTSSFAMSNLIEFILLCYGTAWHPKGRGIRKEEGGGGGGEEGQEEGEDEGGEEDDEEEKGLERKKKKKKKMKKKVGGGGGGSL